MDEVTKEVMALVKEVVGVNLPAVKLSSIRPVEKQGRLNFVFQAEFSDGKPCIIRAGANSRRDGYRYFDKETWVLGQLALKNLPAPRVYSEVYDFPFRGKDDAGAFYLCEYINGIPAYPLDKSSQDSRDLLYRSLGMLMQKVHQIPCRGFGSHFSGQKALFTHAWVEAIREDFNKYGYSVETIWAELSPPQIDRLDSCLKELEQIEFTGHLCHGDLNMSNLLVSPDTLKVQALIDWERALSTLTPASSFMIISYGLIVLYGTYQPDDIRVCFCGDGILPELRAFLEGYGISNEEYQRRYRRQTELLLLTKITPFFSWWHANTDQAAHKRWQKAYDSARPLLHLLLS